MSIQIPTMADMMSNGQRPDYIFWVGCAGSYDARAQKVTKAFVQIMDRAAVSYAILGNEEGCCGDPARRSGNEFLFQMLAQMNIETLNGYEVQKIVATCPHCLNTLANEYSELGGTYEVIHHTKLISDLINAGKIVIDTSQDQGERVTYHDSCYLGRVNGIYQVPRDVLDALNVELVEMKRSKTRGLCCGAGGAQMFKEDEPGHGRINIERVEEALSTDANAIAVNCPFCLTMMTDGVKAKDRQEEVMVYDLAEMVLNNLTK